MDTWPLIPSPPTAINFSLQSSPPNEANMTNIELLFISMIAQYFNVGHFANMLVLSVFHRVNFGYLKPSVGNTWDIFATISISSQDKLNGQNLPVAQ